MNWQYENWNVPLTPSAQRNYMRTIRNLSLDCSSTTFKQVKACSENSKRKAKDKHASNREGNNESMCDSNFKNSRCNATHHESGAGMLIPKSYSLYPHLWKK